MSDKDNVPTIHDFDFDLICEYFLGMDRQGPGSPEITLKALGFIEGLGADSLIADIGCGTGGQTMTLATATSGQITGLDLFPKFIEKFNRQAAEKGFSERVKGVAGSMDTLPFEPESLDLIWCEGAIYNVGFERGLSYWHRFLKPGGYVAVSDNTWFTEPPRPAEISDFWAAASPDIDTVPAKIAAMQRAGYEFVAAFSLPEKCWTDFYAAQIPVQAGFLRRHTGNPAAEKFVASEKQEKLLWDKYKAYWGYTFYIGRKKRFPKI